jgi:TetR/AcrR family transcriptional regulator, transcriptional repressor for nem operon
VSETTDSIKVARPAKRERLVTAASQLIYRRGVTSTTLADIADAGDVPVGNVYYYFKTKEDIVGAVVQAHAERLASTLADLQGRHRTPKARLKALVDVLAAPADETALYGCPYGSLAAELAKRANGTDQLAAPLITIPLDWAEQQFRALGRRDAHDLAVELVAAYQGSALLTSALAQPDLITRQARRLHRWIDGLDA